MCPTCNNHKASKAHKISYFGRGSIIQRKDPGPKEDDSTCLLFVSVTGEVCVCEELMNCFPKVMTTSLRPIAKVQKLVITSVYTVIREKHRRGSTAILKT